MLRKFLSEEEKAQLDDQCRRYTERRRSLNQTRDVASMEDDDETDDNLNAQDVGVAPETTSDGAATPSTKVVRPSMKHPGRGLPGDGPRQDEPSEDADVLKRPVTFRSSTSTTLSAQNIKRKGMKSLLILCARATKKDLEARTSSSMKRLDEIPETTAISERTSTETTASRRTRRQAKVPSIDEIFAKGILDWREYQDKLRSSSFALRLSAHHTRPGTQSGMNEMGSGGYSVRNETERDVEYRQWKQDDDDETAGSIEIDPLCKSLMSSSSYDDYEYSKTEESDSTTTEEQIHRRKIKRNLDIAADILKLLIFFGLSFALASLPLIVLELDDPPEEIRLNVTERNICYWTGSRGFLDRTNPCPYRGYIGNDEYGTECLRWKDAIDGGNGLPGVGIDNIHYEFDAPDGRRRDFSYIKTHLETWRRKYYKRDKVPGDEEEIINDYEYRFCRRLGHKGAVCLALDPNQEKDLDADDIYVKPCWIIPCSIHVASKCYRLQMENLGLKA